jgi:hypothetical protein
MPMTATPVFTQTPYLKTLSLAAVTACTTRAPTATASLAAANIVELTPVSTNGRRVDSITVSACSSAIGAATVTQLVGIWAWDGTTAYLIEEIVVTAVTPSATAEAFSTTWYPTIPLVLPAAFKLFASTTVTTTASTTALQVTVQGGDY